MTIFLSNLGVAFAAFCVWLTVRLVNRRERWAKWTAAAAVGMPLLYLLSVGPVAWMGDFYPEWLGDALDAFYSPLAWFRENGPPLFRDTLNWYLNLFD